MEEFLITPTAWYYMKNLGETNTFLGFTLAAYSAGTLVFSPFIGFLAVKYEASKSLVVMCGLVKLFGNVLYSIPVNGYFPLFGRFICGIGEGTTGVLYGAVTKCTTNENRAKTFLYFEGLYSIGEVCGPAIGSLLIFNFNILGWKVNAGNSPGVILAIIWLLLLILTMFLPSDLAEGYEAENQPSIGNIDSDREINESKSEETIAGCPHSVVFCLYFLIFLMMFLTTTSSTYIPLLAKYHLGLDLSYVKLLYLNCSLFAFVFFVATYLLVERISEKNFIVFGAVSLIFQILPIFYFALFWDNDMSVNAAYLLLVSLLFIGAQFVNFALISSLLSKQTPAEDASCYQSLTFTVAHTSIMLGRILAGASFHRIPMMYTCLCLSICWLFGLIWLGIEYKNLEKDEN
ncbi:major facilitator superfamily domain-containing 8-like [Paramuricea clavata]|uniref:Major facilitator superfamily domain-containing 8-like n=1 Tax=Paramuricea clavata TaxID=317549 RepID=A0A6S7H686_PARCT|nr:major facilitator superfamily domain-containing 8-like [Paramuricea clavata]